MIHQSVARSFCLIFWVASLFTACQKEPQSPDSALLWFQQSAECQAIFLQNYALAGQRLEQIASEQGSRESAVVIDLDETVLDNSPQQAGVVLGHHDNPRQSWDEWCTQAQADLLPGAEAFLKKADSLGFAIFYISNRDEKHLAATVRNLRRLGLPQSDEEHVRLRAKESSKEPRRQSIGERYRIGLLLGDHLNDLCADFETDDPRLRSQMVNKHRQDFVHRFIVFPNPMYGSWKRSLPETGKPPTLRVWPAPKGDHSEKGQSDRTGGKS